MDAATKGQIARSENAAGDGGPLIDLQRMYAAVRRRQWWIAGVFAIIAVLTAVAYLSTTPRYSATATVALDRQADELLQSSNAQPGAKPAIIDSPAVDTAVSVLTSTQLIGEVVDRLGLAKVEGIGQIEGQPVSTPARARSRAISAVLGNLTVKRVGLSYAITVTYGNSDPQMTSRVTNEVVDRYIADQRGAKVGMRGRAASVIGAKLAGLRQQVREAEQAAASYRASNDLINVGADSTAVQQEISVLNAQLAQAQADEAAARARYNAIISNGAAGASDGSSSGAMSSLRAQQSQLSAARADLAERYGPLHPDLARINQQLAAVNANIAAESARVRGQLQATVRETAGRTAAVRASLARAEGGLSAGNAASVQLAELQRNVDSSRNLYQAYLNQYNQTMAGQGTDQSNAYVIARAMVPNSPQSPVLSIFVAAAIAAGLLASILLVAVLEITEVGFRTRREIEAKLGLPVIASVPDLHRTPGAGPVPRGELGPANYLIENPGSVFGESFHAIRTALRIGHADQVVRTLAVCSPLPSEGKTTMSMCLARSAAQSGRRVLLIDCDMRRRASTRSIASNVENGLIEVLKGESSLDRALLIDQPTGMFVLAQSRRSSTDYDLLTSEAMERLIAEVGRSFDFVVLDTAPVLPLAEARSLAMMADGALLVVRWRKTPVRAAELAFDMLVRAGANVQGVALSLVDVKAQARGALGDEMLYYNRFKEYYA